MAQPHRDNTADPLAAEVNDPKLSVHALSEFAFCPRAGLCLYEQNDDYEEREGGVDVSYLPILEQADLEQMLKSYSTEFWGWLLAGGTGAVVCGVIALLSEYSVFWFGAAIIALVALVAAIDRLRWAWQASEYLASWNAAQPRMPDADSPQVEDMSWCDLRASGFAIHDVPAAYSYEPWAFGGRPWKLLEYGDLRIPVFKYPRQWKGLYPKHFVRMTAYCALLEKCTDYRSPYGVIVRHKSLTATIVPKTQRSEDAFGGALQRAREHIKAAKEMDVFPPVPGRGEICSDCPWGRPEIYRRGRVFLRDEIPIDPKPIRGPRRRRFHSHCGDRFRWLPPHKAVERLELKE